VIVHKASPFSEVEREAFADSLHGNPISNI
jgi:hypothetical protein